MHEVHISHVMYLNAIVLCINNIQRPFVLWWGERVVGVGGK